MHKLKETLLQRGQQILNNKYEKLMVDRDEMMVDEDHSGEPLGAGAGIQVNNLDYGEEESKDAAGDT